MIFFDYFFFKSKKILYLEFKKKKKTPLFQKSHISQKSVKNTSGNLKNLKICMMADFFMRKSGKILVLYEPYLAGLIIIAPTKADIASLIKNL